MERGHEAGFTITEMLVSLIVLALFLTLFFQLYFVSESQRLTSARFAAAHDIAAANLRKITSKAQIPGSPSCSTTPGAANQNNLTKNPNAKGSLLATNATAGPETSPTWHTAGLATEDINGTYLPKPEGTATIQTLRVRYPKDCGAEAVAEIVSIVTYTASGRTETVTRSAYVN